MKIIRENSVKFGGVVFVKYAIGQTVLHTIKHAHSNMSHPPGGDANIKQ